VVSGVLPDYEVMADILVDAACYGEHTTAKRWGKSWRTVARYRALMRADVKLAGMVAERLESMEQELGALRVRFLRKGLMAMEKKLDSASLPDIAAAMKVVGEFHQVAEVLGHGDGSDQVADATAHDGGADAAVGPH
jgi:hypothetical protein